MIYALLLAAATLDARVALLADGDAAKRRAAFVSLQRSGEQAVPALQRGLGHADPEVRRAVMALLDQFAVATLDRARRCVPFSPETLKLSRRMSGMDRMLRQAAVARRLLAHRGFFPRLVRGSRSALDDWDAPGRGDLHTLLVALEAELNRVDWNQNRTSPVMRTLVGVTKIERKLASGELRLLRGHWSTSWLVRRRALPALRALVMRQRQAITQTEVSLYGSLAATLRPYADKAGRAECARLRRRLGFDREGA